jgi:vacuolar protein sorting-associated protein 54
MTTAEELSALRDIARNLQNIFRVYYAIHSESSSMSIFNHEKLNVDSKKRVIVKLQLKRGISDDNVMHCFREVPDIFFRADFSLRLPDTFEQALELSPRGHDRLSRYLDLVEVALLRQIWTRSPDFFKALEDIRSLELQVVKAVIHIKGLRTVLHDADESLAVGPIQIPKLYRRQRNEERLHAKLMCMQRFVEDVGIVQMLVRGSDYMNALHVVMASKRLFSEELDRLDCMQAPYLQLESCERAICDHLGDAFVSRAVSGADDVDAAGGLEELRDILDALLLSGQLPSVLKKYQARMEDSHRLIVRTCISEYASSLLEEENSTSSPESERALNRLIKSMSADAFMSCACMCFEQLLGSLTQLRRVKDLLDLMVGAAERDGSARSGEQSKELLRTLSDSCLNTVCELTQKLVAHLLSMRSDANVRLQVGEMKLLLDMSGGFLSSVEELVVGTISSSALRQCLLTQTKGYLNYFHENSKANLVIVLDNERWEQCDVLPENQRLIDRLAAGRYFLPSAPTEAESSSGGTRMRETMAVVDGASFKVVHSAIHLVNLLLAYLDIAGSFPSIITEAISKAGELLALFDSRTKQLVLGAQAMQTAARLRSISAKHLCLAAQSIGLVIAVVPHIRAALQAQLPAKHHILLTGLDRSASSLGDHHSALLGKFVDIVCDFVDASASRLGQVDWDTWKKGSVPYFDETVRNLTALHRVLESLLPDTQLQDVFSRILAALTRKMMQHFELVRPASQAGRQRIMDEVAHLASALSLLKRIDTSAFAVEESFRTKYFHS